MRDRQSTEATTPRRRPLLRALGWTLPAILLLVGGAAAWLFPRLPALAGPLAVDALADLGMPGSALTVARLDFHGLELTGLRLGPETPEATRLARLLVSYDPFDLAAGRIAKIEASGLRLSAAWGDEGLSLGPLDVLVAGDGGTASGPLPVAIGTLTVNDGVLSLSSPQADARLTLDLSASRVEGDTYAGIAALSGEVHSAMQGALPVRAKLGFQGAPDRLDTASAEILADLPPLAWLTGGRLRATLSARDGQAMADLDLETDQGSVLCGAKAPLAALLHPEAATAEADVSVDLRRMGPGLSVVGGVDVSLGPDGVSARPNSALVLRQDGLSFEISPSEEPVIRMPFDSFDVDIALPDARLEAAGQAVALWDLKATVEPDAESITVDHLEVRHSALKPLVVPLDLSGTAGRAADGTIAFSARLGDPLGRLVLEAAGHHDPEADTGTAAVTLHPLRFVPGAVQPRDLFPAVPGLLTEVSGVLSAEGPVSWHGTDLTSALAVSLDHLSAGLGALRLEGIRGRVTFDRPWPPSTPPRQRVVVSHIAGPVPVDGLDLSFRVAPGPSLAFDGIWARLADGVVSIGPVTVPLGTQRQEVVLAVSGVDLKTLIDLFEIADTEAHGSLYGAVPLMLDGGRVGVTGGVIETDGPGVLRYAPPVAPAALQGGGQGATLMLSALENFHYETLRLTADRDLGGEWRARLEMQGANPDLMEGYPFAFNVNLSGKLDEILRRGLESAELPDTLGKALVGKAGAGKAGR